MGQQGLQLTDEAQGLSGPACSPEMVLVERSLCCGSGSEGRESLLPPEQLDSQRHMLHVGQLVCERAEAQDFNCCKGLFVDCVGSNFKYGFRFAEP